MWLKYSLKWLKCETEIKQNIHENKHFIYFSDSSRNFNCEQMTSIVERPLVIFYLAALYYRDLDPRDKIMECYGIINEKSITFSILNICFIYFYFVWKYFFVLTKFCFYLVISVWEKPQNVSKKIWNQSYFDILVSNAEQSVLYFIEAFLNKYAGLFTAGNSLPTLFIFT